MDMSLLIQIYINSRPFAPVWPARPPAHNKSIEYDVLLVLGLSATRTVCCYMFWDMGKYVRESIATFGIAIARFVYLAKWPIVLFPN